MAPASSAADSTLLVTPKSPLHPCGQLSFAVAPSPKKSGLPAAGSLLQPYYCQGQRHVAASSHQHAPMASVHQQQHAGLNNVVPATTLPTGTAANQPQTSPGDTQNGANLNRALKSVCKVFATLASPNYATPWQMHQQSKSTASSFVVAPLSARRILTNAHAVANQIQVQLRKHGNARKFTARVLAVGHECDIAMLTVDDDEFWTGVEALEIGGLPGMQESVSVVGYPTGGDNVCVTKGVVSRVDRQQYSHGRTSLLALQIDAAINSGNSGGPVIKGDKLVGIAFQCLTAGENIGYVIPVPVIHHFLQDLERHQGKYTGFCELGLSWQTLESNDHKTALRMPRSLTGVYVNALEPCHNSSDVLQPGDVITHFNGHAIADDGTFHFDPEHQAQVGFSTGKPTRNSVEAPDALTVTTPRTSKALVCAPEAALSSAFAVAAAASDNASEASAVRDSVPIAMSPSRAMCVSATTFLSPTGSMGDLAANALMLPPVAAPPPMVREVPEHSLQVLSPKGVAQRIDFRHLVSMNFEGDWCELGVWRDGTQLPGVRVQLSTPKQLVPVHSHDQKPHYYIYGGFVFTRLTNFYLRSTYGADWTNKAPIKLCDRSFAGTLGAAGQECVILSKVLAWDCNTGYQDLGNVEVLKVAGVKVHNLAHVAQLLEAHPGPYVRLDLQWNKVVVLDTKQCKAAAEDILTQNCIPGNGCFPRNLKEAHVDLPEEVKEATEKVLRGSVTPSITACASGDADTADAETAAPAVSCANYESAASRL